MNTMSVGEFKRNFSDIINDLNSKTAASAYLLPSKDHQDPFDRVIIWQSIQQQYPLISRNPSFANYRGDGLKLVW